MLRFFTGVLVGIMTMRLGPGVLDQFSSNMVHYARLMTGGA